MPRPTKIGRSADFLALEAETRLIGDKNDCTVKALALTCNVSYKDAHAALAAAGRRKGCGAHDWVWKEAAKALGFELRRWTAYEMVAATQLVKKVYGKNVAGLTTFQPARFPKCWDKTGNLILRSRGHVSACIDGVVHDWANDRAKRVIEVYEVRPLA